MKSFNDLPKILPRFIIKRNMLLSFLAISGVVVGSISVLRGEDRTQRLLGYKKVIGDESSYKLW